LLQIIKNIGSCNLQPFIWIIEPSSGNVRIYKYVHNSLCTYQRQLY